MNNRQMQIGLWTGGIAFWVSMMGMSAQGVDEQAPTPHIGIIIDDMGYGLHEGLKAVGLPGPLAYAILPFSPNGKELAQAARKNGKEVLLHMPMQAVSDDHLLGPGALTLDMSRAQFTDTLERALLSVPLATGVNNHMGSLLTRHPGPMRWLMEAIRGHGYFFVDSRTSPLTVAAEIARQNHVPYLSRDVFLDNIQDARDIEAQFERLITLARERGAALAIAHPHPDTIMFLTEVLPTLNDKGVRLVSLKEMIALRTQSNREWQLSLSPSPTDAKN
ncbi:MAG: divergent polysaccharide deacetylase family protein [Gammaproteobacteria bacterium]|nr:divergent polysaccharide deacetylase family protein [Gammaproteobacteria bacterium]